MRAPRIVLLVSLVAALVIGAATALLVRSHSAPVWVAVLVALSVCVAAAIPGIAISGWAKQRQSHLGELARSVEALQDSRAREQDEADQYRRSIQEIVDSMGEGLMALNRQGQIVFANRRVAEIFGWSTGLAGRSFLEVVRNKSLIAAFDRAVGGVESVDRTAISTGAEERQLEIRVFPVETGAKIAAVALFIDVTHIQRLERMRRDFLDDFSHEVRTPLAGIRSAAETLERRLTPEQEEQLHAIMLRQIARLERLIDDLSELNHIESGVIVLERRDLDLLALAADVCEEFKERYTTQPLSFVVRGEQAFAYADPARVQQVLANLLDNACKYGMRGEILVEVASDRDAVIRVSDEGDGIPPSETERIFNRFYRVDRSRSQTVPGAGLGLAIAKHLVAAHGGSIRAFNRAGRGATFEVRLPISAASARRAG